MLNIVNPLRPKITLSNETSSNKKAKKKREAMIEWQTWRDAAIVALVLSLGLLVPYISLIGYAAYVTELGENLFKTILFLAGSWISQFITLAGLTAYVKKKGAEDT